MRIFGEGGDVQHDQIDRSVGDTTEVDTTEVRGFDDSTAAGVTRMFERLMDVGIDGRGRFDSAQK
ncbi:MAG TPA: hypothetical protein VIM01_09510, partial [Dermatophilaceae bacterium]